MRSCNTHQSIKQSNLKLYEPSQQCCSYVSQPRISPGPVARPRQSSYAMAEGLGFGCDSEFSARHDVRDLKHRDQPIQVEIRLQDPRIDQLVDIAMLLLMNVASKITIQLCRGRAARPSAKD